MWTLHKCGVFELSGYGVVCLAVLVEICFLAWGTEAAPQGYMFSSPVQDGNFDLDSTPIVHRDDDGNVYFDMYAIRGQENKFMFSKNGVIIVSIQVPDDVQDTFEQELWRFVTSTIKLTQADIDILLFPSEAARRVVVKKAKITEEECQNRLRDVFKPYIPHVSQTPGSTEPPPWLTPYDQVAIYAQNDSTSKQGVLKYYELILPKEEKTKSEPIPRKKLVEMKPHYHKDPSWMAKILRDLKPNKGVVFRGRLIPGIPLRPLIDDYRGSKKIKLRRKILQGIAVGSGVPPPDGKVRFEMSHPVPALMVLDYLTPNQTSVASRRVITPVFRNDTMDIVEELEYTEVTD